MATAKAKAGPAKANPPVKTNSSAKTNAPGKANSPVKATAAAKTTLDIELPPLTRLETAEDEVLSPTLRRSASDPCLVSRRNSERSPVARKVKKALTLAVPRKKKKVQKDRKELSEEALADLRRLHDSFVTSHQRTLGAQDLSESALTAAWGTEGVSKTMCFYGQMPETIDYTPLTEEEPYALRDFAVLPGINKRMGGQELFQQCGIAAVNSKGYKGDGDCKLGQDNFSVSFLSDGWEAVCVMDGHGPEGHWPSLRAVRTCPVLLQNGECARMLRKGAVVPALARCFEICEEDLEIEAVKDNIMLMDSGCTAVCAVRNKSSPTVWVAWAGDSRTILIVPGSGCVRETEDHKTSIPEERKRVEELGCEIEECPVSDTEIIERINIAGTGYPGITMSRSLGDLCVKPYGVIATPQVVQWSYDDMPGAMLLAASDGVWEFIDSQQAAKIILDELEAGRSRQEAVEVLLAASQELWDENEGGQYCDDITAVLWPLDTTPKNPEDMSASSVTGVKPDIAEDKTVTGSSGGICAGCAVC
eukprot:TRINITY_DN8917_c0_g1_i1.p1 TRINITY_DN8917_c0_g1~~TRINITY_DN8917_c0_g1_i1.p1  ORF type:complete len:533 (+),score=118.55 TRINITY_DN8917_c0_g1_i1:91-1689(+)